MGRRYTRSEVTTALSEEPPDRTITATDFELHELASDLALLHYLTRSSANDGKPPRHARRTSIWRRTPAGWRIRFHQGTPTDAS